MRVQIRDRDALAQLSLVDVHAYLASQGWLARGRYGSVATIYVKADSNRCEHEILLPAREDLGDYAARMGDIVDTLSNVEGRSQLLALTDLVGSGQSKGAATTAVRPDR